MGASGFERETITRDFGAVLHGLDARDPDATTALRDAVHDHGVVFLRDQHLDDDEHIAVASRFGPLGVYPVQAAAGMTAPLEFIEDGPDDPPKADGWHTDVTWVETPPVLAFLCMLERPERGGDTLWVDTAGAWDALSPVMQEMLAGLELFHDVGSSREVLVRKFGEDVVLRTKERFGMGVAHPLVRSHPYTGRKSLFVAGYFMDHVVGMSSAESRALLDFLMAHATAPERAIRWRWREGDLAIWDERRTMHRALGDHFPLRRRVRRCTVMGERPR